MCKRIGKCEQDDYTKRNFSKAKKIGLLLVGYTLVIAAIIVVFAVLISIEDDQKNMIQRFIDKIYFSGVTFFTIGFGDFLPIADKDKVLVLVEGFIGIFGNGLFLGLFVYFLQSAQCKVQFSKKIYIYKDKKNRFCATVVIKNRGYLIADIERGIDILKKHCDNSTERLASAYQHRNYLNNKATFEMVDNECKEVFNILQKVLKEQPRCLITRLFLYGQDAIKRSSVVAFEECNLEVELVKELRLEPKYKRNGNKLKDVCIKVIKFSSDE